MGRQEQWEAYQDVKAKYQEACDELTKTMAELDEARAIPPKVWVLLKNFTIIGVFSDKAKAMKERDLWLVPFTDESYDVREYTIR